MRVIKIIKIDLFKIKNWKEIIKLHEEYAESLVYKRAIKYINNEIYYIFTNEELRTTSINDLLKGPNADYYKNRILESLKNIMLGEKLQWKESIERYGKIIKSDVSIRTYAFQTNNWI